MGELIAHLFGDYVLQNHAMATRKASSWAWAGLHVALYMLPFLFLAPSPAALAVMAGTHLVIDRFRLALFWTAFWGVGSEGFLPWLIRDYRRNSFLIDWHIDGNSTARGAAAFDAANPPAAPAPDFLRAWLLIIVDNAAHLLINHLAIAYL